MSSEHRCITAVDGQIFNRPLWVLMWETYGYIGQITPRWGTHTHVIRDE